MCAYECMYVCERETEREREEKREYSRLFIILVTGRKFGTKLMGDYYYFHNTSLSTPGCGYSQGEGRSSRDRFSGKQQEHHASTEGCGALAEGETTEIHALSA